MRSCSSSSRRASRSSEATAAALELAAYTNAAGEERIWQAFGGAAASDVEEDWEDRWRQFHRPVRVGPLWIGPPWEAPDEDATAVVIDPGRAFGTGGHPTTQLCLRAARARGSAGACSTSAAARACSRSRPRSSASRPVRAFDFDPQAVEATERNAADNGVSIEVGQADLREDELPEAELALANIAADAVVALGPRLRAARAITSGYLVSDEPELEGYRRERRVESGGWAADLHVRQ